MTPNFLHADLLKELADLQVIEAESMGWQPLGQGAYLHYGNVDGEENVIQVVGMPDVSMAGMNVLLVGW